MDNPWTDLPSRAPYILPSDREPIERFNAMAGEGVRIRPELLPEPFLGAPTASVVLLSLNPGFSNDDALAHAREEFVQACRRNLAHHASDYPFLYLDPRFSDTPGGYWWTIRLRHYLMRE